MVLNNVTLFEIKLITNSWDDLRSTIGKNSVGLNFFAKSGM